MSKAALSNGGGFLLTWQNADLTADGRAASQLALLLSWFKVAETFFKNFPDGFVRQIWPPFFSKQPGFSPARHAAQNARVLRSPSLAPDTSCTSLAIDLWFGTRAIGTDGRTCGRIFDRNQSGHAAGGISESTGSPFAGHQ